MTITEATYALIDTETTGTEEDCELLEVAVHLYDGMGRPGERFTSLVRPDRPIPPEASGIHGITDEDVFDAPGILEVEKKLEAFIPENVIFVAHHAEFDLRVMGWESVPAICSERLAHHLTPDAPNFKLATLRYFYGFKHLDVGPAHRADADLLVLAPVFFHLIARYRAWAEEVCAGDEARLAKANEVATLIEYAKRPYVLVRPSFGKHKTWDALFADAGYLAWMLRLPDLSPEMRWNLEREQKRRKA